MTPPNVERLYHRFVVTAAPGTDIWLIDDAWFLVQRAVGTLDTRVIPGRYYVELDPPGTSGVAYPIELKRDARLTQDDLEGGPTCPRGSPVIDDED